MWEINAKYIFNIIFILTENGKGILLVTIVTKFSLNVKWQNVYDKRRDQGRMVVLDQKTCWCKQCTGETMHVCMYECMWCVLVYENGWYVLYVLKEMLQYHIDFIYRVYLSAEKVDFNLSFYRYESKCQLTWLRFFCNWADVSFSSHVWGIFHNHLHHSHFHLILIHVNRKLN